MSSKGPGVSQHAASLHGFHGNVLWHATAVSPISQEMQAGDVVPLSDLTAVLNDRGVHRPRGSKRTIEAVRLVIERAGL